MKTFKIIRCSIQILGLALAGLLPRTAAAQDAPYISVQTDWAVTYNTSDQIDFYVWDDYTSPDMLVISAASSNTNLVPDSSIAITNYYYGNCTLGITPAPGQTGSTTITLTVTDEFDLSSQADVQVNVVVATNVAFCDPWLEQAVRNAVGKSAGHLTTIDLQSLTSLSWSGWSSSYYRPITNLCGLEYAANLTSLDLEYNSISDLQPLAGLIGLQSLNLRASRITDASPIAALPNLNFLDLSYNPVTCVGLSGPPSVMNLVLDGDNLVTNAACLTVFTQLTNLSVSYCAISDASPLASLTNLQSLKLNNNQIASCGGLGSLLNLLSLDLSYNPITGFDGLAGASSLTNLTIVGDSITNAAFVQNLIQLRSLAVRYNRLSDLNALAGLTNLHYLDASYNWLTNIDALQNLSQLQYVLVYGDLLNLTNGSPAMAIINGLINRSVWVSYFPQHQPPNIQADAGWMVYPNTTGSLTFYVSDDIFGAPELTDVATSSDQALLPDAAITLSGTNYSRTLTITPAANQTGSATITLTLTDPAGLSSTAQVHLSVQPDIFPDTNLEKVVRWALGGSSGPISPADLRNLTALYGQSQGMSDLHGLQFATNLASLHLNSNRITDLSPLAGLTNLYYLDLSYNQLTTIDVLLDLPNLSQVYLGGNLLDISPGSAALAVIQTLQTNGVYVSYEWQYKNQPPSIWLPKNNWLVAANAIAQISFSPWDDFTLAGSLLVSATSSNPTLLPDEAITLGYTNGWILAVTPAASQTGSTTITLSVTDSFGATTQTNIIVTVINVTNVVFCDPVLEEAVREALWKYSGDLTTIDLANLTTLSYPTYYHGWDQITNLCGLEYAGNLTNLSLPWNYIHDLQPLAGLAQLQSVDLEYNPITNTAPLAGLPNLNVLDLANVWIACDGISGLANVKNLVLNNNYSLPDAACLTGLTSLTNLSLVSSAMTNLSALGLLPNLGSMNVSSEQRGNCDGLTGLTKVNTLTIQYCSLTNLDGLGSLFNLKWLDLSYNPITNGFASLAGLSNLTTLYLQYDSATSLDSLPALPQLSYLNFQYNRVSDLNSLAALTNLTEVIASNNRLTNIDGLQNLRLLRHVDLTHNLIDVSPGSQALSVIQTLQSRGVSVEYQYQRQAPSVRLPNSLAIEENRPASIYLYPGDDIFDVSELTFSVRSSNTLLIPNEALVIDTNYRVLDITPATGQTGSATLTVTVTDPVGLSSTNTLLLSVVPAIISDTNLEAGIRRSLNIFDSEAITPEVLSNLTGLIAAGAHITDLSGLELATNLTSLNLGYNSITNLAPLADLTRLQWLSISGNPLTNCSALAGLTGLASLDLSSCHISDLSPLSGLAHLTYLSIGWNPIRDLSPLAGLTNLASLDLRYTWLSNIDVLLSLPHLTSVDVTGCALDLSAGSAASTVLQTLQARGVIVSNGWQTPPPAWRIAPQINIAANLSSPLWFSVYDQISPMDRLTLSATSSNPNLIPDSGVAFNATNSRVTLTPAPNLTGSAVITLSATDEAGLSSVTNILVTVRMATNVFFADVGLEVAVRRTVQKPVGPITTVDMENLTSLDASSWNTHYRAVSNLTGLQSAINLTQLSLSSDKISDLSVLSSLTALTSLDLSGNPVSDLTPLVGLTNLTYFGLGNSSFTDCRAVSVFTNLTGLRLDNDSLTNISALAGLTNLTQLSLNSCGISDLSSLTDLTRLTELSLNQNLITNFSLLARLTNLTILSLQGDQVTNLDFIPGLSQLANLDLSKNRLNDLSGMENLTQLLNLDVSYNHLTNINALANLPYQGSDAGYVNLDGNLLDLQFWGWPSPMSVVWTLESDGYYVEYQHQRQAAPQLYFYQTKWSVAANASTAIPFDIWYDSWNGVQVSVSATCSDPALVPGSGLVVPVSSGYSQTLTVIPAPNRTGTATLTITATDDAGMSSSTNITVTVESMPSASFTDPRLEAAVRGSLNKPSGYLTLADLSHLSDLYLSGSNITSLAGLESATNLMGLDLSQNSITNLQPLAALTHLSWLNIANNQVRDLAPLAGLTSLSGLYLDNNPLTDASPLAGLTNLTDLSLQNNPVNACAAVSGLTNLWWLNLSGTSISNVECLSPLARLGRLYLDRDNLSDVSALVGIDRLSMLSLSSNHISNLDWLPALTNLQSLNLSYNPLTNCASLSSQTNLKDLQLSGNFLTNIDFVRGMSSLRSLVLDHNNITDLDALAGMSIASLDVSFNQLTNISALQTLNLENNYYFYWRSFDLSDNLLDLTPGSAASDVIDRLLFELNFEQVTYLPQLTPLTITVDGCGSITPDGAGTSFKEAGKAYTITARPCPGYEFSAWTGGLGSSSATLSFTMRPGLVLEAHFVPAPFAPAADLYTGLFYDTNGATPNSSGSVTIRTTAKGRFTGALRMGRSRYPFTGKFGSNGGGHVTIKRGNQEPLTLQLQVDTTPGADLILGTVNGGDWTANLTADKAPFEAARNPAPQAGRFTMAIPMPSSPDSELLKMPVRNGHGLVTVNKSGRVQMAASLPDGTKLSQATAISKEGQWGLFVPLYNGRGMVLGWVSISIAQSNDVTGSLVWHRPELSQTKPGFAIQAEVSGSRYVRPAARQFLSTSGAE